VNRGNKRQTRDLIFHNVVSDGEICIRIKYIPAAAESPSTTANRRSFILYKQIKLPDPFFKQSQNKNTTNENADKSIEDKTTLLFKRKADQQSMWHG
jgi:hypothetical protein